jgi:serine/threonine protein kinase
MAETWEANWELVYPRAKQGGQGAVRQVRSRSDVRFGALKTLHERNQASTERRFRMQQEVNALKAIGHGVPQVFETNAEAWADKAVPLYVVMEWVPGPTLSERVAERPMALDEAVDLARALLSIVERSHGLGVVHRDLKPDNTILRDGDPRIPILVDFGIAWMKPGDEPRPFETDLGQEMGNRYLRLPENSPGRESRDPRSDVTLVAGLLIYALSGFTPRVLLGERGRQPHEAASDRIPSSTTEDRRWSKLRRGFPESISDGTRPSFPIGYGTEHNDGAARTGRGCG